MIPEITSVAEFMAAKLGDCTGDKDNMFMILRVSTSISLLSMHRLERRDFIRWQYKTASSF